MYTYDSSKFPRWQNFPKDLHFKNVSHIHTCEIEIKIIIQDVRFILISKNAHF